MWGLSEKEANAVWREFYDPNPVTSHNLTIDAIKEGAKAQLLHVYEEWEKDCSHEGTKSTDATLYMNEHLKKRECSECWAELKQEAGL